ncbi:DUF3307 domain-containing protein [Rhodovarius crocodyli]|uniref:DUF3307 domain-containing protein n=1 Tax=Rhodovarius crocodyli TaxID=1979269 RepID=A0A437MEX1_9PROT|nr:DUF3307 domain-containing protein [Rhodovarius crocodyli]RVT96211.1 DUF3307 domain-containing protein [Rhodovarius crocodyli]
MTPADPFALLLLLLAGHALCDYPLQGDFLARMKDPRSDIGARLWPHGLAAHALIHGGMVTALTGSSILGLGEAVAHAWTDYAKCRGWLSFNQDQACHVACKVVWWALVLVAEGRL